MDENTLMASKLPPTSDYGMNAVRGFAALVVVLAHAIQVFILRITGTDNLLATASGQMASHAVYAFFIVSGYLITQSILKNYRRNGQTFDAVQYFAARIARIYPPLLLAIALTYSIFIIIGIFDLRGGLAGYAEPLGLPDDAYAVRDRFSIEERGFKAALLMANGMIEANGPLWSLCIEWRIYLVAGAVAMAIAAKSYILRALFALLAIFAFYKLRQSNEHYAFYASVWVLGCVVSLYETLRRPIVIPIYARPAIALGVMASILFFPQYPSGEVSIRTTSGFAFQMSLCVGWVAMLFPIKLATTSMLRRWLMNLGEYSYTLFIIHFPIMLGVLSISVEPTGHNLASAVGFALGAIVLSMVVSSQAAKVVERKSAITPYVSAALMLPRQIAAKMGRAFMRALP